MSPLLEELHQDHVHMARLLGLLSAQLDLIHDAGSPDYELMLNIVEYNEEYPDRIHHPKEDVIYRAYLEKSDEDRDIIEALLEEHVRLIQETCDFHQTLTLVMQGAVMSRDEIEREARTYIQHQREHLNTEEVRVFPLIDRTLDQADWRRITKQAKKARDPLFGSQVSERYRALYEFITG
jgi:hemerythrin-like domain-containing protein